MMFPMIPVDQLASSALAGALLLAKSAVVVCIGALAARALRSSAAHRVRVWRSTFLLLLILPLAQAFLPELDVALVGIDHAGLNQVTGWGAISTSIAGWIVAVWFAGAAFSLLRLLRDALAARALCRRATPVSDDRLTRLADDMARLSGVPRVGMRFTDELDAPALIGWRLPIVLLPYSAQQWTTAELRSMLCHELEHVRARDWPVMLLERAIAAVYWPSPLMPLASKASSAARECAADSAVLRAAVEPQAYAKQLLRTARARTRPQVAMSLAFAHGGVEARVRALFAVPSVRSPFSPVARGAVVALLVPVVLAMSAAQPWTCLPEGTQFVALAD